MIDWNIQSRAHTCQACARPFADQQPYHTILFDEKLGYERLDVCEACWAAQFSQGATSRKGFISHWQGVYEVPPVRPEPIQKENAESLLRKLVELNDPKYSAVCFILAVMLERKRVFKVKDQTKRDGKRVFIYEQPKTGDVFTILDPDLQLTQLEEVQRDVGRLLESGLTPPADAPPGAPADGVESNPATAAQPDAQGSGPATTQEERTVAC
ncbi:MAG TPA: hypothetical protein VJW76_07170 [Verrucomicrobiae bacterium]|nr:hypothetical protein [Verrucomicrobiae bacterium]